jgi:hypothetical protein
MIITTFTFERNEPNIYIFEMKHYLILWLAM